VREGVQFNVALARQQMLVGLRQHNKSGQTEPIYRGAPLWRLTPFTPLIYDLQRFTHKLKKVGLNKIFVLGRRKKAQISN